MSDIVTELRSYGQEGEPLLLHDDSLLARAADEIERFQDEVKQLKAQISRTKAGIWMMGLVRPQG